MRHLLETVLLVAGCFSTVLASCFHPDLIRCKSHDRCIDIPLLCDGEADCPDSSDEDENMCQVWNNKFCQRSFVRCHPFQGCMRIQAYCNLGARFCGNNVDPRICTMLEAKVIQDFTSSDAETTTVAPTNPPETTTTINLHPFLSNHDQLIDDFKGKMSYTISYEFCPELFTKIGEECVSVFFMGNMTWFESRAFCQTIGGDLLTIKKDLSNLSTIMKHLQQNQLTQDFWIGGIHKNESFGWQWVDGSEMHLGSPLWAVRHTPECSQRTPPAEFLNDTRVTSSEYCYYYEQAPASVSQTKCAAMTYEQYYYVSDEDCMAKKSPLCVRLEPKQAL